MKHRSRNKKEPAYKYIHIRMPLSLVTCMGVRTLKDALLLSDVNCEIADASRDAVHIA